MALTDATSVIFRFRTFPSAFPPILFRRFDVERLEFSEERAGMDAQLFGRAEAVAVEPQYFDNGQACW